MSAVVRTFVTSGQATYGREVEVPRVGGYDIDTQGRLLLKTSQWGGDVLAVFQKWEHFIITQERGTDGRFVKRR